MPYVKFIISIRTEYVNSSALNYSVFEVNEPSPIAIQSLCKSLKISQQTYYTLGDMPIGFYYIIADVLEKMRPEEKSTITSITKTTVFSKRWEQIKETCDKKYNYDITPSQVKDKLIHWILDHNSLIIPSDIFNEQEKEILNHFQQENLLVVHEKKVEFRSQYYSDYYIVEEIEKNWGKKARNLGDKLLDLLVAIALKCISDDFIKGYILEYMSEVIKSHIKKISPIAVAYKFQKFLLTFKYEEINKKIKLTETQHMALLELLRDRYRFELPVKLLKNKNCSKIWFQSILQLSYEEIQTNKAILDNLELLFSKITPTKVFIAFQHQPWIVHEKLLAQPLKQRDMIFSQILSDFLNEQRLQRLIDYKDNKGYYDIFQSFTAPQKCNEAYQLVWLLTVPHREFRDKATKILINVLYKEIDLFINLWKEFSSVDDPYLIERLYIIGYSILVNNLNSKQRAPELAKILYKFAYPDGRDAYAHIMIQEYGLRVYIWMLSNNIWETPNHLRKQAQTLEFIKPMTLCPKPLNDWIGGYCSGSLRFEYEGSYGDWGRYIYQYAIEQLKNNSLRLEKDAFNIDTNNLNKFKNFINTSFPEYRGIFSKVVNITENILLSQFSIRLHDVLPRRFLTDSKPQLLNVPVPLSKQDNTIFMALSCLSCETFPTSYLFLGKHYIVQRIINDYWTIPDLGKDSFNKFDVYDPIEDSGGRQAKKKERFTKKMQWIAMYEFMGYLRNYLNYTPILAMPESYLYFYALPTEIQRKLLEYLSENGVDEKIFFNTLNISQTYFSIHRNISISLNKESTNINSHIFSYIDEDMWLDIKKVSLQDELQILNKKFSNTNDLSITDNEKTYIKNKLYMDNEWILLYGIDDISSTYTIAFGSRMIIYRDMKYLESQSNFRTPYTTNEEIEKFLEPYTSFNEQYRSESFIYSYEGTGEYDFSNDTYNREVLSGKLISEYQLQYTIEGYIQKNKLVIKKYKGLWYISKDFAKQIISDYKMKGQKVCWWCYFEKIMPKGAAYNEWRANLQLDNNILKGKFKSHPNKGDFIIKIKL